MSLHHPASHSFYHAGPVSSCGWHITGWGQLCKEWTQDWTRTLYNNREKSEKDIQSTLQLKRITNCADNVPGAECIINIKTIKDIMSFNLNCSCAGLVFSYWQLCFNSNRWYQNLQDFHALKILFFFFFPEKGFIRNVFTMQSQVIFTCDVY